MKAIYRMLERLFEAKCPYLDNPSKFRVKVYVWRMKASTHFRNKLRELERA